MTTNDSKMKRICVAIDRASIDKFINSFNIPIIVDELGWAILRTRCREAIGIAIRKCNIKHYDISVPDKIAMTDKLLDFYKEKYKGK